jgi:hypothetical protein
VCKEVIFTVSRNKVQLLSVEFPLVEEEAEDEEKNLENIKKFILFLYKDII